ncbi:MAG: peptidylprolyl isomerase [Gammaproteobacteria bacterium]
MNKRLNWMFAALAAATLAACDMAEQNDTPANTETENAVAVVNGQPISQAQLDVYAERRNAQGQQTDPEDLVNDLISMELLAQSAIRDGLDRRPQTAGELASQRTALLAQAAVREHLANAEISDADVETEYQRFIAEDLGEELNARHILVEDEALARELIEQLDGGANFAELAEEHSTDGSAANGGDLGWFEQNMMVAPFGEAAAALEEGAYTQEPVQTQYGWHVIKLEGRRSAEPPPVDQVRSAISEYLQSQRVERWVNELREAAEVEITLPEAAEAATAKAEAEEKIEETAGPDDQ